MSYRFTSAGLLAIAAFPCAIVAQSEYGWNSVNVNRDPAVIEGAFPAPNTTLHSPAFAANPVFREGWTTGKAGPTDDANMEFFMRSLALRNPWMTYRTTDFASEEGRAFPYVYMSSSSNASTTPEGKLRVWLQGAVHGNEPAGDEAMLALLGKMDAEKEWAQELLSKMDILLLPRYNIDGVYYFQRTLATNYDPNRDHTKLARQQTRDIKRMFNSFAPHIAVDMHEYGAGTRYATNYSNAADGMYSAAKNLNIHPSIRNISEALFARNVGRDLNATGLRGEPYVTGGTPSTRGGVRLVEAGSDAKIGRNAMGLSQTVTFLFETRGIGIADQEFKRRTVAGLTMATSILQTAADHSTEVYNAIEGGIRDFIAGKDSSRIVVTDGTTLTNRTWTMVNRNTGAITQLPVEFESNTPAVANMTRARPKAYIIPRAWADVAERLRVSGLEVETLPNAFRGQVEAYNITSSSLGRSYYEGVVLSTVKTAAVQKEKRLPAGSFWVKTDQRHAAIAFNTLEPENIDSYVSMNIIPMEVGDEYPVYRVL